jgi:hypothetical protein
MSKVNCSLLFVVLFVGLVVWPASAPAAEYFSPEAKLPSPLIQEAAGEIVIYPYGLMTKNMLMVRKSPGQALPGPGPGENINSFFDIYVEVSTDGGGSWTNGYAPDSFFDIYATYEGGGGGGGTLYQTEATALTFSPIPGVMIRESPYSTTHSMGTASVTPVSGGYMIDSFFDIFTELSVDGGLTWLPSETPPSHVEGTPEPGTLVLLLSVGGLGLLGWAWRRLHGSRA